jgi:hypothetical protein
MKACGQCGHPDNIHTGSRSGDRIGSHSNTITWSEGTCYRVLGTQRRVLTAVAHGSAAKPLAFPYITFAASALYQRRSVFPVRYELNWYILFRCTSSYRAAVLEVSMCIREVLRPGISTQALVVFLCLTSKC